MIYKVVKDGHAWDYSNHKIDCERWVDKILSEEPESRVEIMETTREEWTEWRTGF